ncbi:AAA family ATPase [Herbaspirillum sp. RV1423]|uniref:AAA family ATPase n=1 Tax=Herbaspirillum sp. RV1423 TaxID=1443993 RepID=UPI0005591062|nr:AAA family ATPase [Herbaspirillum sp. RV1423]
MAHYIGIAGTHSTGKTTFTELLTRKATVAGLTVTRVGDIATQCQKEGFGILKDHTFESTLWIMTAVINAELKAGLQLDLVIVDRPIQDALGYLEAALISTKRQITAYEYEYLYTLARLHQRRYIANFKTQLDNTIALGPDRDKDLDFRILVDQTISTAHDVLGIDVLPLTEKEANLIVEKVLQSRQASG